MADDGLHGLVQRCVEETGPAGGRLRHTGVRVAEQSWGARPQGVEGPGELDGPVRALRPGRRDHRGAGAGGRVLGEDASAEQGLVVRMGVNGENARQGHGGHLSHRRRGWRIRTDLDGSGRIRTDHAGSGRIRADRRSPAHSGRPGPRRPARLSPGAGVDSAGAGSRSGRRWRKAPSVPFMPLWRTAMTHPYPDPVPPSPTPPPVPGPPTPVPSPPPVPPGPGPVPPGPAPDPIPQPPAPGPDPVPDPEPEPQPAGT